MLPDMEIDGLKEATTMNNNIDNYFQNLLAEMDRREAEFISNMFKSDLEFYAKKKKLLAQQKELERMNAEIDAGIAENLRALNGLKGIIDKF